MLYYLWTVCQDLFLAVTCTTLMHVTLGRLWGKTARRIHGAALGTGVLVSGIYSFLKLTSNFVLTSQLNHILYAVMTVRAGENEPITMAQAYCGLRLGRDPLYGDYASERIEKLRRAAQGLHRARQAEKRDQAEELEAIARELEKRREEWEHDNRS